MAFTLGASIRDLLQPESATRLQVQQDRLEFVVEVLVCLGCHTTSKEAKDASSPQAACAESRTEVELATSWQPRIWDGSHMTRNQTPQPRAYFLLKLARGMSRGAFSRLQSSATHAAPSLQKIF